MRSRNESKTRDRSGDGGKSSHTSRQLETPGTTCNVMGAYATYCVFYFRETSAVSFPVDNKPSNNCRVTVNSSLSSEVSAEIFT